VLLQFSKSCKRTVSDGFVKKSADSDSASDPDEGIINLYTPAIKHSAVHWWVANAATMRRHNATTS